jgi:hypothetical protein
MKNTAIQWSDHVCILDNDHGTASTPGSMSFDEFRTRLMDDPCGIRECRYHFDVDPNRRPFYKLPKGCIVKYVGLKVIEEPNGAGFVSLGIEDNIIKYGKVKKKVDEKFSTLLLPTILTENEALHLYSVNSDNQANGNLNSGLIVVSLVFDVPN